MSVAKQRTTDAKFASSPQSTALPDANGGLEPDLRLDVQLCFALYAASRLMTELYRPALLSIDLTYPQYLVMLILWECTPQSVGDICEKLYLDNGTVTPLLKRLERKGLLSRVRDLTDERQVNISLTRRGRRLHSAALSAIGELNCSIPFSATQAVRLRKELRKAVARMASRPETPLAKAPYRDAATFK
jgi:DNA-binding MarR family transcriptional regulator